MSLLQQKLSNAIIISEKSNMRRIRKISPKKTIDNDSKRKSKRTYSDNNQSGSLYNGNINNFQNKTEINLYDNSLYNKSTSKLKIIKTVNNKISYSNISKKIFNNQKILIILIILKKIFLIKIFIIVILIAILQVIIVVII